MVNIWLIWIGKLVDVNTNNYTYSVHFFEEKRSRRVRVNVHHNRYFALVFDVKYIFYVTVHRNYVSSQSCDYPKSVHLSHKIANETQDIFLFIKWWHSEVSWIVFLLVSRRALVSVSSVPWFTAMLRKPSA